MDQDHSVIDARCHLHANSSLTSPLSSNTYSQSSTIDEIEEKITELSDNLEEENNENIVEENKRVPTGTRVLINDTREQKIGRIMNNEISYYYSVDFGDDTYSHDM